MTTASETLTVNLDTRSYDILLGNNLLESAGETIRTALGNGKCWIISDENVAPMHLPTLKASLSQANIQAKVIVLPPGEGSKSLATLEMIVNRILDGSPERGSTLIALGGGVVGDIAGLAASLVLRGINYVQIPTTLLAQVDSSVGGKTAVNTKHGKNLAGAFYQPKLVIADAGVLDTLPHRELLAGYAEVVKYGLIRDNEFFEWLEKNGTAVIAGDHDARSHAVSTSCATKADLVSEDERETGARALLNFGHTFGHALEAETGFSMDLLHGEAVSIGMILALELSTMLGYCPASNLKRTLNHFTDVGLPTCLPSKGSLSWDPLRLIEHMGRDKKVHDGRITFILARSIGDAFATRDVSLHDVENVLRRAAE
ncbi:MAG: 3-dehydroquinate synthase [Pseudomonadota bacterium]|nr:3-dehydroquinate synthase [Pseudomonadota bacterium]